MRGVVILIAVLGAGVASAEDDYHWELDGNVLCNERYSGYLAEECVSIMMNAASTLFMLEQAAAFDLSDSDFGIDGDRGNAKLVAITNECRKATMDGKRADAAAALLCVHRRVTTINATQRREKRLREEAE